MDGRCGQKIKNQNQDYHHLPTILNSISSTTPLTITPIQHYMFPNHNHTNTTTTTTMPSPRNSYASSTYSTSTIDTIRDAKQSSSSKNPSKTSSFIQKTKKVFAGPTIQEETARKQDRTPTQAMMEKYGAGRGNIMGPH